MKTLKDKKIDMSKSPNWKTFYNENHIRDKKTGKIIERDFSTFKAIECSRCNKPIKGLPSFSNYSNTPDEFCQLIGVKDINNVDYCVDCHAHLASAKVYLDYQLLK
jgi:hypothetical protein